MKREPAPFQKLINQRLKKRLVSIGFKRTEYDPRGPINSYWSTFEKDSFKIKLSYDGRDQYFQALFIDTNKPAESNWTEIAQIDGKPMSFESFEEQSAEDGSVSSEFENVFWAFLKEKGFNVQNEKKRSQG